MIVHDIEVNHVGASSEHALNLGAQSSKIRRKNAWCYQVFSQSLILACRPPVGEDFTPAAFADRRLEPQFGKLRCG
jgi:hypothetical protein